MATLYVLSATGSDLAGTSGGAEAFAQDLPVSGATVGSVTSGALGAAATSDGYAWTPAGDPGASGTSTGSFTAKANITTGASDMTIAAFLAHVDSAGTVQGSEAQASQGAVTATAGIKSFTWASPALGTWAAGDRLRVRFRFTRNAGVHGTATVTLDTGDGANDTVAAPWTIVNVLDAGTASIANTSSVTGDATTFAVLTADATVSQSSTITAAATVIAGGGGGITGGYVTGTDYTLNEAASVTSLACTLPTAMATGKILLADVTTDGSTPTLPGTGGWQWHAGPFQDGASVVQKGLAWTTDPAAGLTFGKGGAAGRFTVILWVRGGVNTTPFDVTAVTATAAATPLTIPQITTVTDGAQLVSAAGANSATSALTAPASMTQIAQSTNSVGKRGAAADEAQTTQGATGTRTWTLAAGALRMAGYLTALRPAAGGPNVLDAGTATISNTSAVTAAGLVVTTATATITQTSTVTADATVIRQATAAIGQASTVAGIATIVGAVDAGTVTISQTSTITATGLRIAIATATISQTSTIVAAGQIAGSVDAGPATISQTSSITAGATVIRQATAQIAQASQVQAVVIQLHTAAAQLAQTSSITASAIIIHLATATISQASTVGAAATVVGPLPAVGAWDVDGHTTDTHEAGGAAHALHEAAGTLVGSHEGA